ncbi:hypothetical protein [Flavobacterium terrigena]|uniref:Uncharacterized protein n=1 Tax=Flavobacterium terrigena TaxID=402734 RepID=A0A1H6T2K3_9FLAO|nr:hypothetical protein [Flavobacterium terrigena]SEI70465.1 hypothetical protein SAMN05660918_1478 [Flavobacterium terrigena]
MKNYLLFFKELFFFAFPLYIIHSLVFLLPSLNAAQENFYLSITVLYVLFFIFSKTILFIVKKVSEKSFDNTGMVFMLATFVKTGIVYFIIKPILDSEHNQIEKLNVFFIFICFLLIETIITVRILNKKQ